MTNKIEFWVTIWIVLITLGIIIMMKLFPTTPTDVKTDCRENAIYNNKYEQLKYCEDLK